LKFLFIKHHVHHTVQYMASSLVTVKHSLLLIASVDSVSIAINLKQTSENSP